MARRTSTVPSLGDAQRGHIEDLVQRNRGLEADNQRAKDQLADERAKFQAALTDVQGKWQAESQEWREVLTEIESVHVLAQLRLSDALEQERRNVLTGQAATRRQIVGRLQRDYKIVLFKERERELDIRVEELEEEITSLQEGRAAFLEHLKPQIAGYLKLIKKLEKQLSDLEDQLALVQVRMSPMTLLSIHMLVFRTRTTPYEKTMLMGNNLKLPSQPSSSGRS